jgi:replication initiation and membrane attachment protein DnaB
MLLQRQLNSETSYTSEKENQLYTMKEIIVRNHGKTCTESIEEIWLKLAYIFSFSDYQITNSIANQVDGGDHLVLLLIIET